MKKIVYIGLVFLIGCAVGYGKPSEIRQIHLPNNQYQIVVDGDPWLITIGKMEEKFHAKARSICPNYKVISINYSKGYLGIYSASLHSISGLIECHK